MVRIDRYLERRAKLEQRPLVPVDSHDVDRVIVIPALRERDSLPHTLESLAQNSSDLLARTLVICVVNNSIDADEATRIDNADTLDYLRDRISHMLTHTLPETSSLEKKASAQRARLVWTVPRTY